MTDIISTTPIAARRLSLPRLELPKFGIASGIEAMASALGQAFSLAYLTPYQSPRRRPQAAPNADLEGRDPSW